MQHPYLLAAAALLLAAAGLVLALAAWLLFRRRDIRVGGERTWKLPRLIPRRARS